MNRLILKRQKTNEPRLDELFEIISDLRDFLSEDPNINDIDWNRNLNAVLDFQDSDGSFKLFDSYNIPSDARVDFCHIPTYICTAILIKAYLAYPQDFTLREKSALSRGLEASCARNLRGHGYEGFKGQIEALNIFISAGLREFLDIHPDLCPQFSELIGNIITHFRELESKKDFLGSWGESYEEEIREINEYFSHRNVFVYGTLLKGEANHSYLENSTLLGTAFIEGYDLYDVGWYPAIVPGDGLIIGELYNVPESDIPAIDRLEGEGSLYRKQCERVILNGKTIFAFIYVYLGDVSSLRRIPTWNRDYVWYVSYGSNTLKERFLCYIKGGSFEGSRYHPSCGDDSLPLAVKAVDIPFDMYFGNVSGSWNGSGVSFLDVTKPGKALGVAYLITREQFEHVSREENSGRAPEPGYGWYEDIIDLEPINGIEAKTITNKILRRYNKPFPEYLNTLRKGIKENWSNLSDEDIEDYLKNCIR
ncbi:gamma-glutamylcyclotransferase [uncultured Methanobrevibacter sp.]|uniref:gamma-glutamylcyclotransferase family protein n=1 Tax=uncultured Methanobrevibacter sp. TaxID=253161 RepID=UPI00262A2A37|nr:gamma-glutamylcyclotransferase family protein [uncultured Methanobrevibacter sp.]